MGLFSTILEKLGLKKDEEPKQTASVSSSAASGPKPAASAPAASSQPKAADKGERDDMASVKRESVKLGAAPTPMSEVDVVKKLEQMAAGSSYDWKVSIVDLLKVLGMDSSKDARIELAKELGCPAELIGGDYSKMNVWLHKEVLKRIAQNGGNIPANLLD